MIFNTTGVETPGRSKASAISTAKTRAIHPIGNIDLTEEAISDLFYDLLEVRHPGWENNDGAFGEFAWDLVADTLAHTHNARFTEYDTEEHEGV